MNPFNPKWFPPPDRPFQPAVRSVLGATAVGITTLLLPQGQFRNIVAVPPMLWIIYNLRQHTSGKPEEDYLGAVNVSMALIRLIDFSILRIPEKSLRRVRSDGSLETAEEIENMTLWQKFCWALDLSTTMRGIGWNWQVKNVDPVPENISRR